MELYGKKELQNILTCHLFAFVYYIHACFCIHNMRPITDFSTSRKLVGNTPSRQHLSSSLLATKVEQG